MKAEPILLAVAEDEPLTKATPQQYGLHPDKAATCATVAPTLKQEREAYEVICDDGRVRKGTNDYCKQYRREKAWEAAPLHGAIIKALNAGIKAGRCPDELVFEKKVIHADAGSIAEGYQLFKSKYGALIRGEDRPKPPNEFATMAVRLNHDLETLAKDHGFRGSYSNTVKLRCRWPDPVKESPEQCHKELEKAALKEKERHEPIRGFNDARGGDRKSRNSAMVTGAAIFAGGVVAGVATTKLLSKDGNKGCTETKLKREREALKDCRAMGDKDCCDEVTRCKGSLGCGNAAKER